MKQSRKLFAIVLSLVLTVVTLLPGLVVTADNNFVISGSSAQTVAGEEVSVDISLKNNPGFAAMILNVGYNQDYFTIKNVVNHTGLDLTQEKNFVFDGPADYEGDKLLTITFSVSEVCQPGDYPIELKVQEDTVSNDTFEGVPVTTQAGVISVINPQVDIAVPNKATRPGAVFSVPLNVTSELGFNYLKLTADFDTTAFELIDVQNGAAFNGTFTPGQNYNSPYTMLWAAPDNSISNNEELVVLTFKTLDAAAYGNYNIEFSAVECLYSGEFDSKVTIGESKIAVKQFVSENGSDLESIDVYSLPDKVEYFVGDADFDISGAQLSLNYEDETSEIIILTKDMVSGFDSSVAGKNEITVNYGGFTTKFDVTIVAVELTAVDLISGPTKTEYIESFEDLNLAGAQLKLTYNNGETEIIDVTNAMVFGFDNTNPGINEIAVIYNGFSNKFNVEILKKSILTVEWESTPTKTNYGKGENLNLDGAKLKVTYNNETFDIVDVTSAMVSGYKSDTAGQQEVTVTYEGKKLTFTVNVVEKPIFKLTSAKSKAGKEVSVTLSVDNNPGVASVRLHISYDSSILTLVNVEDHKLFYEPETADSEERAMSKNHSNDLSKQPYILDWLDDTATQNYMQNGDLVTLTFKISDDAQVGNYPITVSYNYEKDDILDCDMHKVDFSLSSGNIEVIDFIYGDVNMDGEVTSRDRMILSRYLAGWSGYEASTIDLDAADVNMDGDVTSRDRMILSRYLAEWSGYEVLPYLN